MSVATQKVTLQEFHGIKSAPEEERNYAENLHVFQAAVDEAVDDGNLQRMGHACRGAAESLRRVGRLQETAEQLRRSLGCFRTIGDTGGEAWGLWSLANLRRQTGGFADARFLLRTAADRAAKVRDRKLVIYSLAGLAETARILGDYGAAERAHFRAYAMFREDNDLRGIVWALEGTAQMLRFSGHLHAALDRFSEAQKLAAAGGDMRGLAYAFNVALKAFRI